MPVQERATRTRALIIDAAAAAFDENGYAKTSLSDIIARSGSTKGALYFHFSSKEELARVLVDDQFSAWSAVDGGEERSIQTMIDLSHELASDLRDNVRVRAGIRLVIEELSFARPNARPYQQWIEFAASCFKASQDVGDFTKDLDVDDMAHLVVASFTGIQISSHVLTGREDIRKRVADMWTMLLPQMVPVLRRSKFDPGGTVGDSPDAEGRAVAPDR